MAVPYTTRPEHAPESSPQHGFSLIDAVAECERELGSYDDDIDASERTPLFERRSQQQDVSSEVTNRAATLQASTILPNSRRGQTSSSEYAHPTRRRVFGLMQFLFEIIRAFWLSLFERILVPFSCLAGMLYLAKLQRCVRTTGLPPHVLFTASNRQAGTRRILS